MDVLIRPARHEDHSRIVEFNCRLAQESEDITLDPAVVAEGVRAVLDDPQRGVYFVAEVGGLLVGQLMYTLEWTDWRNGWFWWIQSVYVKPDHRRTGVIRSLYEYVKNQARRRNVCGIRLYVDKQNDAGIRTYAALGMTRSNYDFFQLEFRAPKKKKQPLAFSAARRRSGKIR